MKTNITFKPDHKMLLVLYKGMEIGVIYEGHRFFYPGDKMKFATMLTPADLETIAAACSPVMFDYLMMGGHEYNGPVGATPDTKTK